MTTLVPWPAAAAGGAGGGGAWKVAYADFVTAMMAFFLVMWLLGADEETRKAVAQYFRGEPHEATEATSGPGASPNFRPRILPPPSTSGPLMLDEAALRQAVERITEALQNSPDEAEDLVRFEFLADGVRITVLDRRSRPLFRPGTEELTPLGEWVLRTIAWQLERFPLNIEVEGHVQRGVETTDGDGKWRLSAGRAESARRRLEADGIDPARFWRVAGHADREPLAGRDAADEENRRIAISARIRPGESPQSLREALAHR